MQCQLTPENEGVPVSCAQSFGTPHAGDAASASERRPGRVCEGVQGVGPVCGLGVNTGQWRAEAESAGKYHEVANGT